MNARTMMYLLLLALITTSSKAADAASSYGGFVSVMICENDNKVVFEDKYRLKKIMSRGVVDTGPGIGRFGLVASPSEGWDRVDIFVHDIGNVRDPVSSFFAPAFGGRSSFGFRAEDGSEFTFAFYLSEGGFLGGGREDRELRCQP